MGFWNYRVIRETYHSSADWYTIREVHYPDGADPAQATVKGLAYSSHPRQPGGDTLADLKDELERMLEALRRPVLLDARELGEELGD
jgi:hypothetical protein